MKKENAIPFQIAIRYRIVIIIFLTLSFTASQGQTNEFPYHRSKKDYVIVPLGVISLVASEYLSQKNNRNLTVEEISSLERQDVNQFDRNATYYWNRSADKVSNVVAEILPLAPLVLIVPQLKNKKWNNAATLGVMSVEVILFTRGITGITKSLVGRTRPYLYNTSFTVDERYDFQGHEGPIGNTSFFSGHTSSTFAAAVFLSKMYTDIYGKSTWSKIIWGTSLTLASVTAYCRVAAGEHFSTDVIVGAIVGSAVGYAIPALHKVNSEKLSLSVLPNYLSLSYKF